MIFTSSLLGMFLALVVLAFNWKVNRNALFLSLLMILSATSQFRQYLIFHATEPFWLAILINNPSPLWSMTGACLFFYVRSVVTDRFEFRKSDLLHTIPFWISLVGIMPYLLTPFSYKIKVANLFIEKMEAISQVEFNWLMNHEQSLQMRYLLQIGYAIACLWMLAGFNKRRKTDLNRPVLQRGLIHKWLVAVSAFVLLTGLYYLISVSIFYEMPSLERNNIPMDYRPLYVIGVLLTFMPALVLIFPEILYGIPRLRDALVHSPSTPAPAISEEGTLADVKSTTPAASPPMPEDPTRGRQDPFIALSQRVLDFLDREKPYLQQDFSIEELADMLGVPRRHLYYCFNKILKKKFVTLRTEYRIREVKKRLLEADLDNTTLEAIGWSCGFASRSALYRVFTEHEGCSPGEFIEQHKRPE